MTQTLMNFLKDESSDADTVLASVEAFHALAKNQQFCSNVSSISGLLPRLATLCERDEGDHAAKIASLSQETLDLVSGAGEKKPVAEKIVIPTVTAVRASAFSTRGYVYNLVVNVADMNTEAHRAQVESAVINTKGLVSVTIDMQLRNVNIYSSVKPEEFGPKVLLSLSSAGFKGTIGKDKSNDPKSNGKPGYANKPTGNKEAVVKYVDKSKKPKEAQKDGWLGGITSYFW
jgi:hypothetical protein